MSCLLAIDAGNTRTKWAVLQYETGEILQRGVLNDDMPAEWALCERVAVANVAGPNRQALLEAHLKLLGLPVRWHASTLHACGVSNGYAIPAQLGVDRWAAMIAAWQHYQRSCLVVNAGTALTVDMIESTAPGQACFLGGIIMPGIRLMQESLANAAANIGAMHGVFRDFPLSTQDAVCSGSLHAGAGAINNLLTLLGERCGEAIPCILSGGDAFALLPLLQKHILHSEFCLEENLVLQGLWYMERESP
ncbi:type III pantothenate kinase [Methylobacillus sp.]|uniref:type III pantothenate kinase n=1 Tax=Methylobacillus sp. TaxID=56818 RepID=UPI0012CCD1C7|nr:type III pantothenate kinase [Methylobacillus sp.]MPS48297.1 type III pantothenate kinase [Methylobacillus sp.]